MILNRRAETGNQVMVFSFLFFLVIIAGSIALGLGLFFGEPYDVRQSEAQVLALQIKDCVLDHEVDWSRDDAFFTTCRFDRAVLEEDFLVKVHREFVIVGGTLGKVEEDVVRIGSNFESCDFVGKNEHFAQCAQTSFVKGGSGGEEFEVLVGSLHQARRKRV